MGSVIVNSDSQVSEGMGDRGPYQLLGVAEDASFEEIQAARDRQLSALTRESERQSIEQAYDAILMQRLRLRQEGKIPVPDRIRFPERERTPSPSKVKTAPKKHLAAPNRLQSFVDTPSTQEMLLPLGIMSGLTALTVFDRGSDFPSWAIACALLVSLYFLFRKEKRFWRSLLLAFVGLALGLLFASFALSGFGLAVDSAPRAVAVGLCLLVMWFFTAFLR